MSFAKRVVKGIVFGVLTGTAFYILGGVGAPYIPAITPLATSAIGFTGAFALSLFPEAKK